MAINLKKGQRVSLDNGLKLCMVGLGWDINKYDGGADFDLDASVFMLGANGKLLRDDDFIFYNNLESRNGAVKHTGDDRTGGNDGDDEQIIIDLDKVPPEIEKLAICVTINDAEENRQNFGQVSNAYIRLVKMQDEFDADGETILRFDLEEEFSVETALVFAEIYKRNCQWKFNAVASGYQGGLYAIVKSFGGNV